MDIYEERQEVAGKFVTSFFVDIDDIRLNCLFNFVVMNKFKIPEGYEEEMQELIRLGYVSTNGLSGNQTEYYVTEYGHEVLREGGIAMARKRKEAEERMRKETVDCAKESNRIAGESNKIAGEANRIAMEANIMARKANVIAIIALVISFAGFMFSLLGR